MAKLAKYPALRWAAPVVAAALVVGVPLAASTTALAEPVLPARSAEQLLVDVQGVRPQPLSGEVSQVTNLGLPELPGFASPTVSDASLGSLLTLASGTHTWRLWTDGDDASRVALVDGRNETDVIRNGSDVWVWSSADRTAVHSTLPDSSSTSTKAAEEAAKKASSPAEVAADIIEAVEPTTTVTVGRAATVAGRPVYQLILTPKQTGTKVGNVVVSIDSETKVPLRVQVATSDGATAIDVGFTSVSFAAPDASTLTFTAPAGTTVTEKPIDKPSGSTGTKTSAKDAAAAKPTVIGTGWTTVVVSKASSSTAEQNSSPEADETASALLEQLPKVSGSWGSGRLLNGTLVSVVLSDDGRVAAGAVSPDALYDALAG